MDALLATLEAVKDHIDEVPCFMCREEAEQALIVMTEDILEGAPEGGTRAIIVGVCGTCWTNEYHHLMRNARSIMAETGLALPNQLFKADVRLQ